MILQNGYKIGKDFRSKILIWTVTNPNLNKRFKSADQINPIKFKP